MHKEIELELSRFVALISKAELRRNPKLVVSLSRVCRALKRLQSDLRVKEPGPLKK